MTTSRVACEPWKSLWHANPATLNYVLFIRDEAAFTDPFHDWSEGVGKNCSSFLTQTQKQFSWPAGFEWNELMTNWLEWYLYDQRYCSLIICILCKEGSNEDDRPTMQGRIREEFPLMRMQFPVLKGYIRPVSTYKFLIPIKHLLN